MCWGTNWRWINCHGGVHNICCNMYVLWLKWKPDVIIYNNIHLIAIKIRRQCSNMYVPRDICMHVPVCMSDGILLYIFCITTQYTFKVPICSKSSWARETKALSINRDMLRYWTSGTIISPIRFYIIALIFQRSYYKKSAFKILWIYVRQTWKILEMIWVVDFWVVDRTFIFLIDFLVTSWWIL